MGAKRKELLMKPLIFDLYIIPNYGNWEIIQDFVEQFEGATKIENPDTCDGSYDSGFRGCDVPYVMKIKFITKNKYNMFKKEIKDIDTPDQYWFKL
jgi:hypothetical protein